MKTFLKIVRILLLIPLLMFLFYRIFFTVNCNEMSNVYFEWFPYHEGDNLIFKSKDGSEKQVQIKRFEINHTENYSKLLKCGKCEDYIDIAFYTENDSLTISFRNLENPESYFGEETEIINHADEENYKIIIDTIIKGKRYERIQTKGHTFVRSFGLVEIISNQKRYKFYKLNRINKKRHIRTENGC